MMPLIILTVATVFWLTGTTSGEQVARVQAHVSGLLDAARVDSSTSIGGFIDREALGAIADLVPPRTIGPVEDLSDHLGERYRCLISGAAGRSVRLEYVGDPPMLKSVHRLGVE